MSASTTNNSTDESHPSETAHDQQDKAFDVSTKKGVEGGLFQECMKSIRNAHVQSNRMRAVLTVAGLITDVKIYREVIACFYVVTREMEIKLFSEKLEHDPMAQKIRKLGYRFTELYEQDLEFLYGANWREKVEEVVEHNAAATAYRDKIRQFTNSSQVAGAAFVLWGALIIGGGAAIMPQVKLMYGVDATHLFVNVTGPGREKRKRAFVETWDSLTGSTEGLSNTDQFQEIVHWTQDCMQGNNNVLAAMTRNPWWVSYAVYTGVASLSVLAMFVVRSRRVSNDVE